MWVKQASREYVGENFLYKMYVSYHTSCITDGHVHDPLVSMMRHEAL